MHSLWIMCVAVQLDQTASNRCSIFYTIILSAEFLGNTNYAENINNIDNTSFISNSTELDSHDIIKLN